MKLDEIRSVGIVGAGTMGGEIGFVCALAGYPTLLYDLEEARIEATLQRLQRTTDALVDAGTVTAQAQAEALAGMEATTSIERVAQSDLISESVFEELAVKREVWGVIAKHAPTHSVFTTNTSSLAPSEFADATGRPAQFAAMHFHIPILGNRIVDVMTHGGTAAATLDLVEAFVERLGLIPIRIEQESPAYVFNAMLIGFLREALRLLAEGVATRDQIDRVWTGIMNTGAGPFTIMDYVGVDTIWRIIDAAVKRGDETLRREAQLLGDMVARGELGMKSGRGFYDYPAQG